MERGYLYILQSETTGKYYIGVSKDPEFRLAQHNKGGVISTRNRGPWIIKFKQEFISMQEARRMEYRLKKLKRRDWLEQIIKDGFTKIKI